MTQEEYNQDTDHEDVEPEGDPQPVEETPEESDLQTSQPDVPIEAPEPVPVAEGMTSQPENTSNETEQETAPSEE